MDNQELTVISIKSLRKLGSEDLVYNLTSLLDQLKGQQAAPELLATLTLAKRNIQQGIMWMGAALAELQQPNPYPNSRNVENSIVDPTAPEVTAAFGITTTKTK